MCPRAVPVPGKRGNLFWFEELWEVGAGTEMLPGFQQTDPESHPHRSSGRREPWRLEGK